MKKNVGSQVIGAQMITAADGTDFTGAVTVDRTIDGGVKANGDTAAGACTHEGEGFHSYVVAATDCNGDHIAFTFSGSGAITTTIQVYTTFPQTVDNDVLNTTIKAETALIVADTNELQADDVPALIAALDTVVDRVEADTQDIQTNLGNPNVTLADDVLAIPTTAMRGTDNAALASVCTETRLAALTDWLNGGRLDLILDIIAADTTTDIPAVLATLAATGADADTLETLSDQIDGIVGGGAVNITTETTNIESEG